MDLDELRIRINEVDSELLPLFIKRMGISREVAEYKAERNIPILNTAREEDILRRIESESGELGPYARQLYSKIFELSRNYQLEITGRDSIN